MLCCSSLPFQRRVEPVKVPVYGVGIPDPVQFQELYQQGYLCTDSSTVSEFPIFIVDDFEKSILVFNPVYLVTFQNIWYFFQIFGNALCFWARQAGRLRVGYPQGKYRPVDLTPARKCQVAATKQK